ncbi:hypothetical protein GCM10023196_030740 [Actinoallomurus vinaceus]|uniref:Methyltransferase type 11 domain-containing protein n=1 Tax=Actinoallomurus vinaceus TaxID=1080074 RepID=A0ABP8UC32_9ACTN
MAGPNRRDLGRVFNEVAELYDRVRPRYPDEMFADLATITGMNEWSSVLEVGCGTGQATRSLAAFGCTVTAIEPGTQMAVLLRPPSFANTIQPGEEAGDRRNMVGARKFVGAGQVPSAADPAGATLVGMATPADGLASLGDLIGSQRRRPTTSPC